ncbi:MAG: sel1 repeat family protein [Planctomycetes bacterium]|nr:sel1 repeat family protein [Planctomycetota bacterium]
MKVIAYHIIALIITGIVVIQTAAAVDVKNLETRARQGDAEAIYEMGKAYEDGVGVLQNYVQAHVWYNLSASKGYTKGPKQETPLRGT